MSDFSLNDAVYVVTGGGTGLGRGIAERMVDSGASVVITGRREGPLKAAVQDLGEKSAYLVSDVTLEADARKVVSFGVERFGRLDGIVNNAGIHLKKPVESTEREEFASVLDVHVMGAFLLVKHAVEQLAASPMGHVLFISSMSYYMGMDRIVAYTAAKSAVAGMTRQLSAELAPRGVRVNAIAPGWIGSDMLEEALGNDPPRRDKILSRIAMHRFGDPEDIGNAAVYLCSPAAKYVTGVVLPVDGGAVASL
ncbi:MAG: SDR family NAD(P)-dependent oxidoreductase [Spirochaetota bacterium]